MFHIRKKISKFIWFTLSLAIIFSLNLCGFQVTAQQLEPPQDTTADKAPQGYQAENTPVTYSFTERVKALGDLQNNILLIEDVNPWGTTKHHTMLQSLGTLKKVSSTSAPNEDFSNYDLVILSNDQYDTTYTNYEKYRASLEDYIAAGGVVIYGNSLVGWNYYWYRYNYYYYYQYQHLFSYNYAYALPVGITQLFTNQVRQNKIANPLHPVVSGSLTDNIPLIDANLYQYGGVSYSRFYEDMMPKGGTVILRDNSDGATLIEYPFGRGTVFSSSLLWEYDLYMNGTYASKTLKNLYTYALSKSAIKFTFDISSAVVEQDEIVDITVSMRNNTGFSGLDFDFSFENYGKESNIKPISITPSSELTKGIFSSNLDTSNTGSNIDWNKEDVITVTWSDADNIVTDDADLFTIRFDISEDALSGIYGMDIKGTVVDKYYQTLEHGRRPGSIQIFRDDPTNFLFGDTHFNDLVEIRDATRLSQFLVAKVALSRYETRAANVFYDLAVNGVDGIVDIKDAIKLSQWLSDYDNITLGDGPNGTGLGRIPTK
jgi:hypothetical protein